MSRDLPPDPTAPAIGSEALDEDLVDGAAALAEAIRLVRQMELEGPNWAAEVEAEAAALNLGRSS